MAKLNKSKLNLNKTEAEILDVPAKTSSRKSLPEAAVSSPRRVEIFLIIF